MPDDHTVAHDSAAAAERAGRRTRFPAAELWLLAGLSTLLHFWRLYTPHAVAFDEHHYELYTGEYLAGMYMFDVHPPLGRLLYAAAARLLHVSAASLLQLAPAPMLRILPAAVGSALVPLVYILLRQLGASRRVATLGAVALLCDNALLVISRFILIDIFLIVFGLAAIVAFLAARTRVGGARWTFLAASATLAGAALSVKWTGASALGVVLAAWFSDAVLALRARSWKAQGFLVSKLAEGALLVAIPVAVYLGAFAIHFAVLTHSGPGDAYMSPAFRAQLPGTAEFNPLAPHLSFWTKLGEVNDATGRGNDQLRWVTNPGSSPWYTWPIMKHPFMLWSGRPDAEGTRGTIHLLGNPLVWWAGLGGLLIGIVGFAARRERFAGREFGFFLLLGALLLNYLPFIAIRRIMYLYHYLFALTLLVAFSAYSVGTLAGWMDDDEHPWRFASRRSAAAYLGVIGLFAAGFAYFLPFTYGWPLSVVQFYARFWVLHPRL